MRQPRGRGVRGPYIYEALRRTDPGVQTDRRLRRGRRWRRWRTSGRRQIEKAEIGGAATVAFRLEYFRRLDDVSSDRIRRRNGREIGASDQRRVGRPFRVRNRRAVVDDDATRIVLNK